MSFLSENVIPGDHGKIFSCNATNKRELDIIRDSILTISGIRDVVEVSGVFPKELIVHTDEVVHVKDIEKAVMQSGYHVLPKGYFPLAFNR